MHNLLYDPPQKRLSRVACLSKMESISQPCFSCFGTPVDEQFIQRMLNDASHDDLTASVWWMQDNVSHPDTFLTLNGAAQVKDGTLEKDWFVKYSRSATFCGALGHAIACPLGRVCPIRVHHVREREYNMWGGSLRFLDPASDTLVGPNNERVEFEKGDALRYLPDGYHYLFRRVAYRTGNRVVLTGAWNNVPKIPQIVRMKR